jgi:hypothetical protein
LEWAEERLTYSFSAFQDLPDMIREPIAWSYQQRDAGKECGSREITARILDRYVELYGSLDRKTTSQETIGFYLIKMDRFLDWKVHRRMVRCYVDNQCDMLKAKLAWTEDY